MTEQEALDIIKDRKLKPFEINAGTHCSSSEYEIDGYWVSLVYCGSGKSKVPDEVEICKIEEQFESDLFYHREGSYFLQRLPESLFDRLYKEMQQKELQKCKEDKQYFIDNHITTLPFFPTAKYQSIYRLIRKHKTIIKQLKIKMKKLKR